MNIDYKLVEVANIFQRISETSSKNEKISIIKENNDNELFRDILKFVFDDFIRTGISTKKMSMTNLNESDKEFDNINQLMDYVKENNTGKLQVVSNIKQFSRDYSPSVTTFIHSIFAKNIKVGITSKSINKALGKGFIKEFSCQLAYPMDKYINRVDGSEFVLTQKLDGHRCIAIYDKGRVNLFTRKGFPYEGLELVERDVSKLAALFQKEDEGIVLDGELVLENVSQLETKDLFRATAKVLKNSDIDKTGILFNVFDWIPLDEFYNSLSDLSYKSRRRELDKNYEEFLFATQDEVKVKLVPSLYIGKDTNKIAELQDSLVTKLGWEGLMLNFADGKYATKRTSDLLKIKKFYSSDVLVLDVYEGSGVNKGRLGGVIIQFKDTEVQVGSGFSEQERIDFWNSPENIIGKIIEVQYFEESENQNGGKSLRFPTYKTLRAEKTVEDINYES
ncbi:RNA ligase family protein [Liquorilactobacillus hordei]|uniref:DNA ligase, ATP-dependent n=1 Tax=Liquorilactobacillus hordei DSM 19519 TaxID=1423759 RepID=A0A0R1MRY9_9LACO|nr:RNA ligase family protein [Liquorilactobacillus hordei]KRL07954.1 DNA ligase, ATP-dependent [Liquorilactobacillus hordei DSM 19519]QYH51101.1 ligase [Liquorilactobacillus hordei DSM 19519]